MLCMSEVSKESKQCKRQKIDKLYAVCVIGVERKQTTYSNERMLTMASFFNLK